MSITRLTSAAAALTLAAALAACTSAPTAATGSAPTAPSDASMFDAVAGCGELSDVGTLLFNLRHTREDGRLLDQEWTGGLRLAWNLIARAQPTDPGVTDAIDHLRELGPGPGAIPADWTPESPEWMERWHAAQVACQNAGLFEFGTMGWVGG